MMLPPPFVRQMQSILGTEYADFAAALQETPPVSIRYNTSKRLSLSKPDASNERPSNRPKESHPVPWHPQGRYLTERPIFTLDPVFHAGAYYVQEASSMFLYEALRQTVDFTGKRRILDLCAAPGGKSTLLADLLSPDSLLIANEVIRSRVGSLRENLERWGSPNVGITCAEAEVFGAMDGWFDVVVCDAPCSGEGLFRKDPDAVNEWSPAHIEFCAGRQRRILAAAVQALMPGGILVYSTCTYNLAEDEGNADWLVQNFDLAPVILQLDPAWGVVSNAAGGCHFFPHRTQGEGFYLAVFQKDMAEPVRHSLPAGFKTISPLSRQLAAEAARWLSDETKPLFFQTPAGEVLALPATLESDFLFLDKHLKTKWFGVNIGEFKGKGFIPSHALALSQWASPQLPFLTLRQDQALFFLKKETFDAPGGTALGWTLAQFEGLNLGWMKILPNRMNNYLPPERRIRMDLGRA